jgi:hypothetical protein
MPYRPDWRLLALLSALLMLNGKAYGQEPEIPGEEQFAKTCARCHRNATELVSGLAGDVVGLRANLDEFLPRHHGSDPATRNAIVDYLAGIAAK